MAINLHTETNINTPRANERVLPIIREWFGLADDAPISVDMDLTTTSNGAGVLEIRLVKMLTTDEVLTLQMNAQVS